MVGALLCSIPINRATRFLGFLGAHSYSVYLWHLPVIHLGVPGLEKLTGITLAPITAACLAIGAAFAFGVVMAKLIEFPALALRERIYSSGTGDHACVIKKGQAAAVRV